ncbi:MAG: beta-ketoacyl synthase N-terminal-like domain-containing protein [Candidatus Margulisiibacteriota bacterium]
MGLSASPFQILKEAKPWEKRNKDTPRRAAVSAFGFGGINAHVLLEEWVPPKKSSKKATLPKKSNSPIAIVGMDAHFGPWETLKAFQERAVEGKNGVKPKPKKNWFGVEDSAWFKEKFRNEIPFKGYGIEELSIPFGQFRIPPKELEEMLTQQLLMLKVAAGALADAGRKESDHLNSGCFIGIGFDLSSTNFFVRWSILNKVKDWAKELSLDLSESELEKWMRSLRDASSPALNANRVMGSLGNIVASRIAREYRFGGPSFAVSSEESSGLSALQAAVRNLQQKEIDLALVGAVDLAGDIRALINTDHAKDIPFGEGAGAVVLKRFEDAQKDRDKIYAVIKEIGAGKTEELVPDARADIGHAGAASAMASLIKTSLCLYHGILAEGPRRAGVNSSGVDGNCAHVMLEAYQETSAAKKKDEGHQSPSSKKPSRAITIPVGGKPFQIPFPEQKKSEPPALVRQFESTQAAKTQAHQTFLRLSQNITETISKNLAFQMQILKAMGVSPIETKTGPQEVPRSLDREQCMEFAVGKIGKVLGPKYVEIDQYPTRVRLPDEPMMFVDRITEIEGEALSLTSGRVVTEHDVLHNGWYLDGGRIPTCNAIEAGQADLFLSGYLGIDFKTKGRAVYRLLDATVTFHDHLPKPGDTIRYDIRILNFFTQGDTYLFRFEFDGAVNGNPILSMRNGCAGFFSPAELAAGKGIVQKEIDKKPMPKTLPEDWKELVPMCVESYSEEQLDALRAGDLAGCFGPDFEGLKINKPFTLPGGKMKVIHRVQHLDSKGGRYGSGLIRAEADMHPKDWFLTCHFSDDNVMPGTLMYECCLHSLRIFLLRMGWVTEESSAVWEPVPGVSSQLKCRGQVLASTKKAAYEITIKELGYRPEPYAVADGIMYADGKPIVEVTNMCVQLTGATREQILALWKNKEKKSDIVKKPAIYDHKSILAFAEGKPSEGFGELYKPFDEGRFIARFPRPPYNFIHRATEARSEPWKMVPGGMIETQYDLPSNEWYFSSNRTNYMPFAVLLEIALQTCGWYSAYMGSALASESDLHYRNLGGVAVMYEPVFPDAGVITARAKSTKVSSSGGMVIQHYDFEILREAKTVYKGNTYFGFFSKQALAQQEGIRDAKIYKPRGEEMAKAKAVPYPTDPPFPDKKLRMIDQIDLYVPDGGPNGLGFIRGSMKVDPGAWFFKAHFYQDPVVPGSLGLESMLQVLKFAAFERWGKEQTMLTVASGIRHEWIYRGQVLPQNSSVSVDAWITSIDEKNRVMFADGFLSVDGLIIYQMKDFSLRMGDGKK